MPIESIIGFEGAIHVVDIGAAAIGPPPPYRNLLDRGLARLSAVDGDERQLAALRRAFGAQAACHCLVIGDGERHTLHLCAPESGMSSILKPSRKNLAFFNGFARFGTVFSTIEVETVRLADVAALQGIDFLKMDVQGAELMILQNGGRALDQCVAIQLEASFVPLYEGQPSLGQIDLWMREHGFHPHCFTDVKRWSITPTTRGGDFRKPFNQLLECDIVYVRELVDLSGLADDQVRKLLLIAAFGYSSPDLMAHCGLELERRQLLPTGTYRDLLRDLQSTLEQP